MSRFTLLSFYSSLVIAITGCTAPAKKEQRPNILFAIADDTSWKHLGAYGCRWVKTPSFDSVA